MMQRRGESRASWKRGGWREEELAWIGTGGLSPGLCLGLCLASHCLRLFLRYGPRIAASAAGMGTPLWVNITASSHSSECTNLNSSHIPCSRVVLEPRGRTFVWSSLPVQYVFCTMGTVHRQSSPLVPLVAKHVGYEQANEAIMAWFC